MEILNTFWGGVAVASAINGVLWLTWYLARRGDPETGYGAQPPFEAGAADYQSKR